MKNFQLTGTLQLFDHVEKQFALVTVPENDHMISKIFKVVKFLLNYLPDKNIDAKKLLQLAEPFT